MHFEVSLSLSSSALPFALLTTFSAVGTSRLRWLGIAHLEVPFVQSELAIELGQVAVNFVHGSVRGAMANEDEVSPPCDRRFCQRPSLLRNWELLRVIVVDLWEPRGPRKARL